MNDRHFTFQFGIEPVLLITFTPYLRRRSTTSIMRLRTGENGVAAKASQPDASYSLENSVGLLL